MEKSLLEQDRASEQVRCENNRLKQEMERLNKKFANYEPMQEELEKLVWTWAACLCLVFMFNAFDVSDQKNSLCYWKSP